MIALLGNLGGTELQAHREARPCLHFPGDQADTEDDLRPSGLAAQITQVVQKKTSSQSAVHLDPCLCSFKALYLFRGRLFPEIVARKPDHCTGQQEHCNQVRDDHQSVLRDRKSVV